MDMTGWVDAKIFLQTVDDNEMKAATAYLTSKGIATQMLTLSERMMLDPSQQESAISTERYSIAVPIGGFPQVIGPVLNDLIQRVHGGGWTIDPPGDESSG
jgi:hypothetical protein